jgi:hypothetical protein
MKVRSLVRGGVCALAVAFVDTSGVLVNDYYTSAWHGRGPLPGTRGRHTQRNQNIHPAPDRASRGPAQVSFQASTTVLWAGRASGTCAYLWPGDPDVRHHGGRDQPRHSDTVAGRI